MATKTVTITSKGQATIPKEIRDHLKSRVIEFEITKDAVIVKPVRSVGGALGRYSRKFAPLRGIRDRVWEEAANERAGKKTPRH